MTSPHHLTLVSPAMPLCSLTLAALDTETTGLDPASARIIEIGGIRIDKGRLREDDVFHRLVDPGIAIPPESTAIHGLTRDDLATARRFADIKTELDEWIAGAVVLGYAVDYDIAVLKREHEQAGLRWRPPRSLDVRELGRIAAPQLPDHSLETLANWLGIEIRERHRAIGDARAAAEIFLRLIPHLRERGITTLAEAEARCRALGAMQARAGWMEASGPEKPAAGALARIDVHPYQVRVREVMSPPIFVAGDTRLRDVLRLLIESKASSVFVKPDPENPHPGIITERDLLRVIDAEPHRALHRPAGEVAVRPLEAISEDAFLYRAIGQMNRKGYRHLGVRGSDGAIVGALSARRLLRRRAEEAIWLGTAIEEAATPEELGSVWGELTLVARSLHAEEVDARDIAGIISHELCALTARACQIAEAELSEAGSSAPRVDYAMLVLGSGGRGESLLAMDQDNAIVYASGDPGGPEDRWLERLGSRVADILNAAGVPYCKGGVMARNPEWRMSLAAWRETVRRWIGRSRPEDLLNTDIFFDAVTVHGERGLGEAVRDEAIGIAGRAGNFLRLLSINAARFDVPLGWFGRFQVDNGRMDLKRGGLLPIFSTARVLALNHGVKARSTPERLKAVRGLAHAEPAVVDRLIEAHRIFLSAILAQQLRDLETGIKPSNWVAPSELSSAERDLLRWALEQVRAVPNLLGDPLAFS